MTENKRIQGVNGLVQFPSDPTDNCYGKINRTNGGRSGSNERAGDGRYCIVILLTVILEKN